MKTGVVIFPGSNCDRDVLHAAKTLSGQEPYVLWHKDKELPEGFGQGDLILIPGGFSYGDYLRPGAIARFSPIMQRVKEFSENGGYVWGICNGFQILCEMGMLPGILLRNNNQRFICRNVFIRPETNRSRITENLTPGKALKIPIAHADGRFYADAETLKNLEANDQVLFRYCNENGEVTDESNPNGAALNIAGICNAARNVFGMMPHPERSAEAILGNTDGAALFEGFYRSVAELAG